MKKPIEKWIVDFVEEDTGVTLSEKARREVESIADVLPFTISMDRETAWAFYLPQRERLTGLIAGAKEGQRIQDGELPRN